MVDKKKVERFFASFIVPIYIYIIYLFFFFLYACVHVFYERIDARRS